MLVRGDAPIASKYLLDALAASQVHVRCNTSITEVRGDDRLAEAVTTQGTLPATAIFVFVGVRPASDVVGSLVVRDARGFILTGPQLAAHRAAWPLERDPMLLETSVPGIFAVGDVRAGTIGRVAWAAGEGGAPVSMILEYLRGWDAGSRGAAES
jgi:thioredoxin reductase (NADPH)